MTGLQFPHHLVAETVRAALAEDLGLAGDITTNALIPADAVCEATLGLREDGRIAGLPLGGRGVPGARPRRWRSRRA